MHDFKSHFQDFLAYCTRPVSVHLAMASVGYSFNSFSIFVLSLKQQNLLKLCFPVWPYPLYFILVNCMGWQVCKCMFQNSSHTKHFSQITPPNQFLCKQKQIIHACKVTWPQTLQIKQMIYSEVHDYLQSLTQTSSWLQSQRAATTVYNRSKPFSHADFIGDVICILLFWK